MADPSQTAVSVFISYSHDSPEHVERVLAFTNRLASDGIDVTIDQTASPFEGWPFWMESQIEKATFVLVVCTAGYLKSFKNKGEVTKGRGVAFEIAIIYNCLYDAKLNNERFIPILFEGSSADDIPMRLKGYQRYEVSSDEGYKSLCLHLTNQRLKKKPPATNSLPFKGKRKDSLPGTFSLEQLSTTMSNPKYAEDILRLDRTWERASVINRETIIIVVGTNIISELLDRSAAEVLRDQIDERGGDFPFRRGVIVTHEGWYSEREYIKNNAVIAIGGPKTNKLIEEFEATGRDSSVKTLPGVRRWGYGERPPMILGEPSSTI